MVISDEIRHRANISMALPILRVQVLRNSTPKKSPTLNDELAVGVDSTSVSSSSSGGGGGINSSCSSSGGGEGGSDSIVDTKMFESKRLL